MTNTVEFCDQFVAGLRKPISIGGLDLQLAEPTTARLEQLDALLGTDAWDGAILPDSARRLVLLKMDNDAAHVRDLLAACCVEVPEVIDISKVKGVQLMGVLTGFFALLWDNMGTLQQIVSAGKLSLPVTPSSKSQESTSPKPNKKLPPQGGRPSKSFLSQKSTR